VSLHSSTACTSQPLSSHADEDMKSACHRKISQHDSPSYLAVDASDTRFAWAFVKIKVKNHRSCRSRGNRRPRALPRSEGHCFLLLIILPLLSHWNVRPSKKFGKYSVWLLCELRRPSELHQAPGVEDCHLVEPVFEKSQSDVCAVIQRSCRRRRRGRRQ